MRVLVDTPVWSWALRNRPDPQQRLAFVQIFKELIQEGRVCLIGPVRQEILSGIRQEAQYEALREHLRAFPEYSPDIEDFEMAAGYFNLCRQKGIQGSHTDFLICAMAIRYQWQILTPDHDFQHYAQVLPLKLWVV
ncbi:MAG: PIN domain-containing protein [Candidatus Sericytochromatia bacterium]